MIKKIAISLLLIIVLVFSIAGSYYYFKAIKSDRLIEKGLALQIITSALKQYKRVWDEAPQEFSCGDLKKLTNVDENYFKNNPDYFQCFLERGKVLVKYNEKKYYVFSQKYPTGLNYKLLTRSTSKSSLTPIYGVEVILKVVGMNNYVLKVVFEDTFHETYLPKRKYGVGPFLKYGDLTWDNFGLDILIDKYLVTYRDLIEWKYHGVDKDMTKDLDLPMDKNEWMKPAANLTYKQMKRYCNFRGKELLVSHIYDASTFHPVDLNNAKPFKVVRGPYPWTFYRKNISEDVTDFNPNICSKLYTTECRDIIPYEFYDNHSASWIGMYQTLGGYMESVNNQISPAKNLIPSSFYFDFKSPWHQLGVRGNWAGSGHNENDFSWMLDNKEWFPEEKFPTYKVGFRCMRYVDVSQK